MTQASADQGLLRRYEVKKRNGNTDPDADYFVLRLDWGGDDQRWVQACRKAVNILAGEISDHLPRLAADIRTRYPDDSFADSDDGTLDESEQAHRGLDDLGIARFDAHSGKHRSLWSRILELKATCESS